MLPNTVEWVSDDAGALLPGRVKLVDQTTLPAELTFIETADPDEIWTAIKTLQVRGAPAIGIAAAMGVAAAVQHVETESGSELVAKVRDVCEFLATARPTAINLFWALDRMQRVAEASANAAPADMKLLLVREATAMRDEDEAMCRAIGKHGVALLRNNQTVLTHCNAGSLATARYGTALAPIYTAIENGMTIRVYADETRPLLQGARLTTWELMQVGIDVTLICDNVAAQVMKEGKIDVVMVGSDRIAANGDAANKIGTYGVALLAKAHNIPFYVLAPTPTFDMSLRHGDQIPIEKRDSSEVTQAFGKRTAPAHATVYSPAFDVTPAALITGIVCEKGIARPPYHNSLRQLADKNT